VRRFSRIINPDTIRQGKLHADPFLHFIYHRAHGTTQAIAIIPVIARFEEIDRGNADNDEGKYANKDDRTVYLVADIEVEELFKLFAVDHSLQQQRNHLHQEYKENK